MPRGGKSDLVRRMKKTCYAGLSSPYRVYSDACERLSSNASAVLDVGCGRTIPVLSKLSLPKGALSVGIDLVASFDPPPESTAQLFRADCTSLPFDEEAFDLVVSRSVLEHLEHPEAAFAELYRVLRPGGHAVILTPNWWDYVSLGSSLVPNRLHPWLVGRMTGRAEDDTFPTRYRANTTTRLAKLADNVGLRVVSLELPREHPHYLQFNVLAYTVGLLYEQTVQRWCRKLRPWILATFQRPDRPSQTKHSPKTAEVKR